MATIVLAAAGTALGSSFGGTVLGLSGALIGRAVGATVGRMIDQRLLGAGAATVESGRIERLRLMGAGEGGPVPRVWGRVRLGGQVIWATRFVENTRRRRVGGGKGAPRTKVREYSYSISLAVALCEGEIVGIGRIWADGAEVQREDLTLRVYTGSATQMPDPKIEAVEGTGCAPAYRGIAYVVFEDLELAPYGNRVPQFSFEVLRSAKAKGEAPDLMQGVRAVAMIPGTGENALSTTPIGVGRGGDGPVLPPPQAGGLLSLLYGGPRNVNSPAGRPDLLVSLDALTTELPQCRSVALVVSWFGTDLRCGHCAVRPLVEHPDDRPTRPWRVSGLTRETAQAVALLDGRPVYGGTPSDDSVIEAIEALRAAGQEVLFYPFLLMEQMAGNTLPDPWTGETGQPVLPWRGRITLSTAPGLPGSPDRTAAAEAEVAAFFGAAQPGHFALNGRNVVYTGPADGGYRRMILHYAWLAKAAGGVSAFCVGSEFRGLTQLRGAGDAFPAVAALRQLAAEVRAILGPDVRISYAADWSEYFGYLSPEGNRYFHLDPFWADENVDFVGIDNYMPLSDWREGDEHADAGHGAVHDLRYLMANVAGGEGFDWFYASPEDAEAQLRTPITDGAHGEPWVWRYKDLAGWWQNPHHDRIDGVRQAAPTPWVPRSKPFWFTELGCAAVDKGTNQPNLFLDPKSSESFLPRASDGRRDDAIQLQYHRAMMAYWTDPAHNPVSDIYEGPMVDMARAHVWAWDARPFPAFPARTEVWSDGENWARGHWITGRTANQPLGSVVAEICARGGVGQVDVTQLDGVVVRGYVVPSTLPARAALQTLMLAYGVDGFERDGRLVFRLRRARPAARIAPGDLALRKGDAAVALVRASEADTAGRVRLLHVEAEGDFEVRAVEAALPFDEETAVASSDLPLVLTEAEARAIAERWLAESRVARDGLTVALPPSSVLRAGDVFALEGAGEDGLWRIDRLEATGAGEVEAVRVEPGVFRPGDEAEAPPRQRPFLPPVPVLPVFLDLPLLTGREQPHTPHLAIAASPWPGAVAVFDAGDGEGFALNRVFEERASLGISESPLPRAAAGLWDRGPALRVRMLTGTLHSAAEAAVFSGANLVAIGDGTPGKWEVFQFARATLVGADRFDLSRRLRGQFGTEAAMPGVWPPGSLVVVLDTAVEQLDLLPQTRGLDRRYRVGPAARPHDDPTHVEIAAAFDGIGLRPYAPVHLRARRLPGGALRASWIRRTRLEGDSWAGSDVPLGEQAERYRVQVLRGDDVLRSVEVTAPVWVYGAAEQAADGAVPPFRLAVAQLSQAFGPGPSTEMEIDD